MELREALLKLDEQEDIADFLHAQKITGDRGESSSCVISNYLYETTSVRYHVTEAYIASDATEEIVLHPEIPECVKSLINEFDAGFHPRLVTPVEFVADPAPQDPR